jgi:hypothetical protein
MEQPTIFSHMKVQFDDIQENWEQWGDLVEHWINERQDKPDDVEELVNRMKAHRITGAGVYGPSNPKRKVKFISYGENDPLVIMLPTKKMLVEGEAPVHVGKPYPLPVFYDKMYDCKRKVLTDQLEARKLAACRVGEYTINECC